MDCTKGIKCAISIDQFQVYIMTEEIIDSFFVLEKHDVYDKEVDASSPVFKCIKAHTKNYVSHFTTVVSCDGLCYYVSVIRIRKLNGTEKLEGDAEHLRDINSSLLNHLVPKICQEPSIPDKDDKGTVRYLATLPKDLKKTYANCYFTWGKNMICSVTDVGPSMIRFDLRRFESSGHHILDDKSIVYFEATFVGEEKIAQPSGSHIILPGMLLGDFLNLRLTLSPGSTGSSDTMELFLELLHITLVERTAILLNESGFPMRFGTPNICRRPIVRHVGLSTPIFGASQNYGSSWQDFWLFNVPSHMYNCRFPSIEVTLFSNNFIRHYFLEIEVMLRCKGQKFRVIVHQIINVAAEDFFDIVEWSPPENSHYAAASEEHSLTDFSGLLEIPKVLASCSAKNNLHYEHCLTACSTGSSILADFSVIMGFSQKTRHKI